MLPHQQRVIDEKNELDIKAKALADFIGLTKTLDTDEQECLKRQAEINTNIGITDMSNEKLEARLTSHLTHELGGPP